jgi:protein-S-isoprenylcysteine O-methyltransferase Ste14
MMPPLERFRFHSVQEPEEQNLVRIPQAVKGVLLVQGVQAVGNFLVFAVVSSSSSSSYILISSVLFVCF